MNGPERIGDVLARAVEGRPPTAASLAPIVRRWPGAVGELIAREAWPARLTGDGVLLVHCASAVWASELQHLEDRLRTSLEEGGIRPAPRMRFRVGAIPRRPRQGSTPAGPAPLSAQERERARAIAAGLRDARMRDAVEAAAGAVLRRRENG